MPRGARDVDIYAGVSVENTWRGIGKKRPQRDERVVAAYSAIAYLANDDTLESSGYHLVHHGNSNRTTTIALDSILASLSEACKVAKTPVRVFLHFNNIAALRRTMGKVLSGRYPGIKEVIPKKLNGPHVLQRARDEESRAVRREIEKRLRGTLKKGFRRA